MVIGIGTDIVEVVRIEKTLNDEKFLNKTFTDAEIEYCRPKGAASFAGLFAAKEAVAKAMGTGFRGFFPRDVEIWHDDAGQPRVKLSDKVEILTNSIILISIAHEKAYATAAAIIMEGENGAQTTQPTYPGRQA